MLARSVETMARVRQLIEDDGHEVGFATCDIVDPADCANAIAACVERFGGVDVVVNNAHHPADFSSVADADLTEWRTSVDVNLFGGMHVIRAALPWLRRSTCASVVNVNSMAMQIVRNGFGAYAVTKGGMAVLTRLLAQELGVEGIRVNGVHPGYMWCESVEEDLGRLAATQSRPLADVVDEITAAIPLGRIPSAEEVAGSIVFLASDLAAAVTGQALCANGGQWMSAV
jgi:NAD(P)-dependent dehydrogenase (short-subunit alcohol dehydrogenase family)